jgi:hypothetical protein
MRQAALQTLAGREAPALAMLAELERSPAAGAAA